MANATAKMSAGACVARKVFAAFACFCSGTASLGSVCALASNTSVKIEQKMAKTAKDFRDYKPWAASPMVTTATQGSRKSVVQKHVFAAFACFCSETASLSSACALASNTSVKIEQKMAKTAKDFRHCARSSMRIAVAHDRAEIVGKNVFACFACFCSETLFASFRFLHRPAERHDPI
jgi:hypothetical protein